MRKEEKSKQVQCEWCGAWDFRRRIRRPWLCEDCQKLRRKGMTYREYVEKYEGGFVKDKRRNIG